MRGFSTRTSNDGLRDVSEPLAASGSSGRNTSQTRQASNASAMMSSEVFPDVFMPSNDRGRRGDGQATEGHSAKTLCAPPLEYGLRIGLTDRRA
jgi:hypothetical protein